MRFWGLRGALQLFAQMTHIGVLCENERFHMPQKLPEKLMDPTGAEKITSWLKNRLISKMSILLILGVYKAHMAK